MTARHWTVHLLAIVTFQFFALHPRPTAIDALVLLPSALTSLYLAPSGMLSADPAVKRKTSEKGGEEEKSHRSHTPAQTAGISNQWSILSLWSLLPAAWRPHLRTILHTDSSRKIFYFLLINLAYMGVQLGYGVYTNSLGLISDGELLWQRSGVRSQRADMTAIHMFFDCLGIGVGLWASIAATWKPDGRYTFGYGRVETLSGFANGKSIFDPV